MRETGIRVVDADGQNPRVLTTPPGNARDRDPAWSPDGKEIAFTRTTPGLSCGTTTCNGYALLVVNVETGAIREVLPTAVNRFVYQPDWSPDGRRIAAYVDPFTGAAPGIELIDARSGARTAVPALVGYNFPRFSPDGDTIVAGRSYLSGVPGGDIRLIRVDGTVVAEFDKARGGSSQPTFTPDGRWISFVDCRPDCGLWSRRVLRPEDPPGTLPEVRRDLSLLGDDPRVPDWQPIPIAVQILTGPSGTIGARDAVFAFSLAGGTQPAGEYRCRLDGLQASDWAPCTSPRSYGTLPEGDYSFAVRFVRTGEDPEGFPVTRRAFKVDRTPPSVTVVEAPPASTESRDVTVRFSSSHSDGVTFRCRLDGGAEYDCSSPQRLVSLSVGTHTFSIVARDAVGNASQASVVRWEVVEPPPDELPPGDLVVEPPPPPAGPGPAPPPAAPEVPAADKATCGARGGTVTIGVLTAVSLGECFKPTPIGNRMLNATASPVKINGVLFTPQGSTKIVVDARMTLGVVHWTGPVTFSIGAWSLPVPFSSSLPVTRVALTSTQFVPPFMEKLKSAGKLEFAGLGFAVAPTFELSDDDGGTTQLTLKLELPKVFSGLPGGGTDEPGGGLTFEISLKVANTKAPSLAAKAEIKRAYLFSKLQLEDIAVAVDSGPPLTFEGSGKLKLVPYNFAKALSADANVELKIELGEGGAVAGVRKLAVQASDLQKPLGYGIFLQRLGGEMTATSSGVGATEWTLGSSAGVSFGPKLSIKPLFEGEAASLDGAVTLKWGENFSVRAAGNGAIVTVPVANGAFEWQPAKGRIDLDGNLDLAVGEYGFRGAISNAFFETAQDAKPRHYNVEASAELRLGGFYDQLEGKAETVLSEKGYAACYGDTVRIGLAALWGDPKPELFARGCDIGPYRSAGLAPRTVVARSAQATGQTFSVAPGTGVKVLALTAATSAPRVRLIGPGARVIDTSTATPVLARADAIVVADQTDRVTRIALRDPPAGTWTIQPVPGSEPPLSLQIADQLPAVRVAARQLPKRDGRRTLSWKLTPIAGQQVTFVERAGSTLRPIATTSRARGRIAYTPAATAPTTRTIEALVTQDGLPRTRKTLARYNVARAPLRRVRNITRRGKLLSWRAAPGSSTYAVLLRTQDGTTHSVKTARNRLQLPLRARRSGLLTKIVTITADGRISKPSTRRFPARRR